MVSNGAGPSSHSMDMHKMGLGVVRVVSSPDVDGYAKLVFNSGGEWSYKFGMNGSPIPKGDLYSLLETYSFVTDPTSRDVVTPLDDIEELRAAEYIRQNKERLLQGLVGNLERTLDQYGGQVNLAK